VNDVSRTAARPTVHYEVTAGPSHAELAAYRRHVAEVAARRERDRVLRVRWEQRQAAVADRDRRTRKVLIVLGGTVGVGVLAGVGLVVWLIWHAVNDVNWSAVVPIFVGGLVVFGLIARAGRRCVIVVQHWHE
jgi:hypothetical protein